MNKLAPIYELPSVRAKVAAIRTFIDGYLLKTNLFGWRYFIDDLKVDIELEIYKYEEKFRSGEVHKPQGAGAYCNMATQGAKNYAAFYNAQKRKALFEAVSLTTQIETDKGTMTPQLADKTDHTIETFELLTSIQQEFGEEVYKLAQKVLNGETLSKKQLAQLRTPKLQNLLLGVD